MGTHDRISALIKKRKTSDLSLHHVRTQQEGGKQQTRKSILIKNPTMLAPRSETPQAAEL